MIIINSETVGVLDAAELATAVGNTAYNYIYLVNNIQLTAGITIYAGKPSLVIDGFYPLDGTGVQHQLTDMNSILATDTLGIRSASSINLTLRNMTIIGRNYYGVPYVAESTQLSGVRITYENVTYSGPQMVFNTYGTTRFVDCNITINYPADPSRTQEVGEVCKVEMAGRVNIQHNDTNDAVFWFRGNRGEAYFRVFPDADVTINTNSYFMFAAFYNVIFWDPLPVAYDIQSNASFVLNTNIGISQNSTHQASSFLVESGASFIFTQAQSNGTNNTLYLNGDFTVNQDANVYMEANFTSTGSLIRFTTANTNLRINDPKSCVFYSRGVAVLSFANQIGFSLSGGQLNYWLTATAFPNAGTFADIPTHKWHKDQYSSQLECSGTSSSTSTTVSAHNFTQQELNTLPLLTNLHLFDARVLSIGNVVLNLNPVVNDQTPVNGTADPNANIRVQYTVDSESRTIFETATASGSFEVQTPETIPLATAVRVSANIPFLILERDVETIDAGELTLVDAPALIRFLLMHVSENPLMLAREFPDAAVEVSDTRVYSTAWTLAASISGPLTTASGHTLPDAVVFVDDDGFVPLGDIPTTVFIGEPNEGVPKTTYCTWQSNRGILLHVTEPILNERHSTNMRWELNPV